MLSIWHGKKQTPSCNIFFEKIIDTSLKYPDFTAVSDKNRSLTYSELIAAAKNLANFLQQEEINHEKIIPILCSRKIETIIAMLGISMAGGCFCPLDGANMNERLKGIIHTIQPDIVINTTDILDHKFDDTVRILNINHLPVSDNKEQLEGIVENKNLAYIIFTSGSTGVPKGIKVQHLPLANALDSIDSFYKIKPEETFIQSLSFAFDPALWTSFWPLQNGAHVYIASESEMKDPDSLSNLYKKYKTNFIQSSPAQLRLLLSSNMFKSLEHIKHIVCGGEAFPLKLFQESNKIYPQTEIINVYGPTETTIHVLSWSSHHNTLPENLDSLPLGYPIANTSIYIVDKSAKPVPFNIEGEIAIGGMPVALGYLSSNSNKGNFREDLISSNGQMYLTGDIGFMREDGMVIFLGREDEQIQIRGQRVEINEVRMKLLEVADVTDAFVFSEKSDLGDEIKAVLCTEVKTSPELVMKEAKKILPDYMCPSVIKLVSSLPVNNNGKVDAENVKFLFHQDNSPLDSYGEPGTSLEAIWKKILGHDEFSHKSNFFDVGGNSLKLLALQKQILNQYEIHFKITDFFSHPSLSDQEEALKTRLQAKNRDI